MLLTTVATVVLATSVLEMDTLTIGLANGSDRERATSELLQELYEGHDFRDWIVTREILIDAEQIPHSHPVLTLHTRHLEQPDQLLSTFVHEQFHWWVQDRQDSLDEAIADFREIWPQVPDRADGGARDEFSTYLHLVVCDLEYQAVALLLGQPAARAALERFNHYEWIYERVLGDPRVREVMTQHGFVLE